MRMAAEPGEERAFGLFVRCGNGVKQMKSGNGAAGAMCERNFRRICGLFMGEDQRGPPGTLDDARGEDADHTAVPAGCMGSVVVENKARGKAVGRGEQRVNLLLDLAQRVGCGRAAVI